MVLFVTPAPAVAGPMTISGYAWGHIVATGPQQSAGTSAPLILTHDPCIWHKPKRFSIRRPETYQTQFESFVGSA